jgi:carbonic anhydrase
MLRTETHIWKPFADEFSGNLAIFCSDERFVPATLDFLGSSQRLERCDLFVIPGGPAFIVEEDQTSLARLELLVSGHKIRRIILIAHADCRYYQLHRSIQDPDAARDCQSEEVRQAAETLRSDFPAVSVEAYYAGVDQWGFVFTPLSDPRD